MEHALAIAENLMPALSVDQTLERYDQFRTLVAQHLVKNVDYGVLPHTEKHCLFKPGAEKLKTFYGLSVQISLQDSKLDWERGFFYFRHKASTYRNGQHLIDCERVCHSWESKYRYLWIDTTKKPSQAEGIDLKLAGLGRWRRDGKNWVWQERRENPDPFSLVNTVTAMSQKRSFVGVILLTVDASGFFAQDQEFVDATELHQDE